MSQIELFPPSAPRPTPKPHYPRTWLVALAILCMVAMGILSYLVYMKLTGQISSLRGCGGGNGCQDILGGRWSSWFLVPVSVWALGVYLALVGSVLLNCRYPKSSRLRTATVFCATLLLGAAIWFLIVQAAIERQFCLYCCSVHACGVVVFGLVGWSLHRLPSSGTSALLRSAFAPAIAATLGLVLGQVFGPQPASHEMSEMSLSDLPPSISDTAIDESADKASTEPAGVDVAQSVEEPVAPAETESVNAATEFVTNTEQDLPFLTQAETLEKAPRFVSFLGDRVKYDVHQTPLVGSPTAEHILVKYFDYTCATCREMHSDLDEIMRQYPGKFAIAVVPTPMNRGCNPYVRPGVKDHEYACELARLGLAVWLADRDQFESFHDYLFKQQGDITATLARTEAVRRVGEAALKQAEDDLWIADRLDHSASVYRALSRDNPRMPKLLIQGNIVMHGIPVNSRVLLRKLRETFLLTNP